METAEWNRGGGVGGCEMLVDGYPVAVTGAPVLSSSSSSLLIMMRIVGCHFLFHTNQATFNRRITSIQFSLLYFLSSDFIDLAVDLAFRSYKSDSM